MPKNLAYCLTLSLFFLFSFSRLSATEIQKPRVIILSDINNVGGDPAYAFQSLGYPGPDQLKKRVAQNQADAVARIIAEARMDDVRPLYMLVWGGMETLHQALNEAPEMVDKLRVLTIATHVMADNPDSRQNAEVDSYCKHNNWNGRMRDDPSEFTWGGRFWQAFPEERPNYWIDEAGTPQWDYADPCNSWDLAMQVYKHRVQSLLEHRAEMYDSFRQKMQSLYPGPE